MWQIYVTCSNTHFGLNYQVVLRACHTIGSQEVSERFISQACAVTVSPRLMAGG